MHKVKTLRMGTNSPDRTWEFVCPDRVRFVEPRYEEIDIGKQFFVREGSGEWAQQPHSITEGAGCDLWLLPLVGANQELSPNYEFESRSQEKIGDETCDSWLARDTTYPHSGGQVLAADVLVCINPASHLVLQLKQGDSTRRFYDFNRDIVIQQPSPQPSSASDVRI
jgi:hypothetical protein